MKEKSELVHFDGEEHVAPQLYQRTYFTAELKPRKRYYAVLTDWQHERRRFPLGKDLKAAIRKIFDLDRKNHAEVDFDELKQKHAARGMTFSKFVAQCPQEMRSMASWHLPHLEAFFGRKLLAQIDNNAVVAYRDKRKGETVMRHGEKSIKPLSETTINKEVGTLRKFLRHARTKGFSDKVTEFKMETESARNRVLTAEEYATLQEKSPAWLRRAIVMAWETALSRSDIFDLTWPEIDTARGIIELRDGRNKTEKPQAIPIFTPELVALIAELQAERRRVPNIDDLVFTIDGQPIDELVFEYHFRKARKAAGIKDFTFHDLRHCAITRWAAAGVPTAAAMLAAGHSSVASHKRYQNLSHTDLKAGFEVFTNRSQGKPRGKKKAASS
jgi:integrase